MLTYEVWKIKDNYFNDEFVATISNVRMKSFKEELHERNLVLINKVASTECRNEALLISDHVEF